MKIQIIKRLQKKIYQKFQHFRDIVHIRKIHFNTHIHSSFLTYFVYHTCNMCCLQTPYHKWKNRFNYFAILMQIFRSMHTRTLNVATEYSSPTHLHPQYQREIKPSNHLASVFLESISRRTKTYCLYRPSETQRSDWPSRKTIKSGK